jgi:hypothetical protein
MAFPWNTRGPRPPPGPPPRRGPPPMPPRSARMGPAPVGAKRGGYAAPPRGATSKALAAVGGAVGNYLMPGVGGLVGSAAGHVLGQIAGSGAYTLNRPWTVESNSLEYPTQQVPTVHSDGLGIDIVHREYFADLGITTDFHADVYPIDPTNAELFAWLGPWAPNFQEYEIMGMIVEFRSTAANAVSGGSAGMGTVTLGIQYDPYEEPPLSKVDINNLLHAVSGKPSVDLIAPVECKRKATSLPVLRIKTGSIAGEDKRFFQFGNLVVATAGAPTPYAGAGELWVSYHIRLRKPRVNRGDEHVGFHYYGTPTGGGTVTAPLANGSFYGNTAYAECDDVTRFTFPTWLPQGTYVMMCMAAFESKAGTSFPASTLGSRFTAYNYIEGGTFDRMSSETATGVVAMNVRFFTCDAVDPDNPALQPYITLSAFGVWGANPKVDILFYRLQGPVASAPNPMLLRKLLRFHLEEDEAPPGWVDTEGRVKVDADPDHKCPRVPEAKRR